MLTKKRLKDYLYDRWDVRFDELVMELKVPKEELSEVRRLLKELEDEEWIIGGNFKENEEYSPGDAQYRAFNTEAVKRRGRIIGKM